MAKSDKIRILHLTASEFVGGPEKQILHHAIDLNSPACEMLVGSFRNGKRTPAIVARAREAGLRTLELPPGKFDIRTVFALARFLREEKISLICTHTYKANVTGFLASPLAGCPQIGFVRGWLAETWKVRQYERLDKFVLSKMDWVACVSRPQAQFLKSRRGNKRSPFVIPNSALLLAYPDGLTASKADLRWTLNLPANVPLFGAVGRLSIEKGHRFLLEAMKSVIARSPRAHLVLLGEGRERKNLESLAEALGIRTHVTFADFQRNVAPWIRACDIIVNPSLTEGIPNVVLESMVLGTPVVATAVGGVPDLIQDGRSGRLVRGGDSSALAATMVQMLEDPQTVAELATHAYERVAQDYSPQRQKQLLVEMYEEVLCRNPLTSSETALLAETEIEAVASAESAIHYRHEVPQEPFLSIVIPVRNEEKHLGSVLERLVTQNYPKDRMEIIVADGNSTDKTAGVVEDWARRSDVVIKRVPNPAQLSSAGRNAGVRNSRGDVIIFIDGHCEIPDGLHLKNIAGLLVETGADCLCRPQPLTTPENNDFQNAVAHVRATPLGHGRDSTIYDQSREGEVNPSSAGAIYRRRVFDKIGYYDESFDACEDVEFNHRVFQSGLRSIISPRLTVYYHPRKSLLGLWKQMIRYGRGRIRLSRKHSNAFSASQAAPAALLLWVLVGGGFTALFHPFFYVYLASLALYGSAVLVSSAYVGWRYGFKEALWAPPIYLTIHFGLGAGLLMEAIGPPQRAQGQKSQPVVATPD
jgi:succinoglycan biosynthesis protein ExoA